jgi:hypothetical protein
MRAYAHNRAVVRQHTVDISESGSATMLQERITLDEVVGPESTLPAGKLEGSCPVRQRLAFRHGFDFIESGPARTLISPTPRDLTIEESLSWQPFH